MKLGLAAGAMVPDRVEKVVINFLRECPLAKWLYGSTVQPFQLMHTNKILALVFIAFSVLIRHSYQL